MSRKQRSSRRDFAKTLAVLGAAPLAMLKSEVGRADQPEKALQPLLLSLEAQLSIVRVKYGKHLNDEQLSEIIRVLARIHNASERLKQVKLQNSDEPAFVFHPE